jgi:hypothetical protein
MWVHILLLQSLNINFVLLQQKCVQYWPHKGTADYGFLTVKMIKEEVFAYYVIRTLSVEPSPNQGHYIKVGMMLVEIGDERN